MNKTLLILLKTAGLLSIGLLLLLLIAIVALPSLVNTSAFKQQLIQQVQERSGQRLSIEGDLSLSVFPWLGLKTDKVTLSQASTDSASGFSGNNFLEIKALNIGVKLLPLLQQKIEVGQVELVQPRIYYLVSKEGKTSLDSFSKQTENNQPAGDTTNQNLNTPRENKAKEPNTIVISGIKVIDGEIIYDNKQSNTLQRIQNLNIDTGNLLGNKFSTLTLSGALLAQDKQTFLFQLNGKANIDIQSGLITAEELSASVDAQDNTLSLSANGAKVLFDQDKQKLISEEIVVTLNTEDYSPQLSTPLVEINLKEYFTSLIDFSIKEARTNSIVNGSIEIKDWDDIPMLKGKLQSQNIDLIKITDSLELDYQASDASALKSLSFTSSFSCGISGLSLHDLNVNLDDSKLYGDIAITSFTEPSYRFDLNLDTINLDRYLPKTSEHSDDSTNNAGLALAAPIPIFKKLTANGVLRADKIQANGAQLSDVRLDIESKNKQVIIKPQASLYSGTSKGIITFSEGKTQSNLSIDNQLSNINLGPLLRDTEISDQLSGKATANINLNISDKNGAQTNQGLIKLVVKDGALKGLDIQAILDNTQSKIDQVRGKQTTTSAEGSGSENDETRFAEMTATLNIENNTISNKDLSIKAPAFRVSGKGSIELAAQTLDYLTNIAIVNTNDGQGGKERDELKGAVIPVRFYGKINEPKYKIDTRALIKENTKREVDKKKEELKEKLAEKLGLGNKEKEDSSKQEKELSAEEQLKEDLKKKLFEELLN